ncbi:uncharacterized protein MELLADRAFT_123384 [Melampsora larici-populina 98AG31]|uniref:Secreted protein n=1 Tax=Melampsora larici-populina (strain 98AG31 / pathotype 3-4-7) TaxID=747676 RepID=F4RLQ5_MELLP|nr:uncharacterized protein MELLADRAFT_123384 [Melampsora larici-populina 98AG31]EGG06577.1 secreted protein [Melampsora larici-populina 98AG31]
MLQVQVFLKISLLLFSLCIHHSRVLADDATGSPIGMHTCNSKFSIGKNSAVCTVIYDKKIAYNCKHSSCWYNQHQYIEMTGCQLEKSTNKNLSKQQCAQYEYLGTANGFTCTNPAGITYTCPYKADIPSLDCTDCQPQN